ncbi:MAG: hAT transposon family protein, partial [Acinetobacter sp.]|nr:hAT transposon family protein [Acinetobacter sp.]
SPLKCLKKMQKTGNAFPNLSISLRILLTIPVTTTGSEQSFSKLKIIKNYLRSTMTQERLSNLTLLSIEHKICENLNLTNLINEFAEMKARKIKIF